MRLLLIGNFLSGRGGVRGVCEDLADRLEGQGHAVLRTSSRASRVARLLDMLWTIHGQRAGYDIAQLDLYGGPAFRWGEMASRSLVRRGKPFVVTLHGGSLPELARHDPGRVGRALARAERVTSPSPYLARELAPLRDTIEVLPNGLDLTTYPARAREICRPRLLWLRAFHAIYQPDAAVRCLRQLVEDHPAARLTMIGPDKGDGSLEAVRRLVTELDLADRVRIEGAVAKERIGGALAQGDVFLNTSRVDNAPVTVTEAMACGLCVVSTDAGGLADLVRHEETGLLVPTGDPPAMARAVRRVLEEPGLAGRLSHGARADAGTYDWSHVLPRWEELLEEALGASA